MPEFPEVEKAAQQLTRAALGKTIASMRAIHPALKRKLSPAKSRAAKGKRIESIERRGKHQLLHLDSGDTLIVHFRMNGDWDVVPAETWSGGQRPLARCGLFASCAQAKEDRHQARSHGSIGSRRPRKHLRGRSVVGG